MKTVFKTYILLVKSWSKPGIIILLFATILLFNLILFPYFTKICLGGKTGISVSGMLDTRLYYSAGDVQTFLASKTESEKKCSILVHVTADAVYPVIYSIFLSILFSSLVGKLTDGSGKKPKLPGKASALLIVFPLLILLADYLENTFIVILLAESKTGSDTLAHPLAYITPFVTSVKWSFVLLNLTALLILTTVRIIRKIKAR